MNLWNLVSLGGFVVILAAAWLTSYHKRRFPVKTVLMGSGLQLALGGFVIYSETGRRVFANMGANDLRDSNQGTHGR